MKRLLILFAFAAITFQAQAQFTAGNLAIVRIGDGTTPVSGTAYQISIVEYTTTGTATGAATTLSSVSLSASATSEGALTLSADRNYLALAGYQAATGTATVNGATANANRVAVLIPASGTANVSTTAPQATNYNANNVRGAVTSNGTDVWMCGTGTAGTTGGVRYKTVNTSTDGVQIATAPTNARTVNIFNNQLYLSTGSTPIGIYSVGTGLPTSAIGGAATSLFTSGGSPYAFLIYDVNTDGTPDLIYIADDGTGSTGGIRKYSFESGTWTDRGCMQAGGISTATGTPVRGLCGVRNNTSGSVTLYATGSTNAYSVTDATAFNAAPTATLTSIVASGTGYVFRGIAFTPGAVVPVALMSFTAAPKGETVQMAWATASEKNSSFFAVERGADGKNFQTIGKVAANGNSNARHDYTFSDNAPLTGVNYYRLRQVDFDETSQNSAIVSVLSGVISTKINRIFPSLVTTELQVETQSPSNTILTIIDLSGRVAIRKTLTTEGYNRSTLNVQNLAAGTYFITLESGATKVTEKFVKQ